MIHSLGFCFLPFLSSNTHAVCVLVVGSALTRGFSLCFVLLCELISFVRRLTCKPVVDPVTSLSRYVVS